MKKKKTLSEIAAQLRECAEVIENDEELRTTFPEGLTDDQIVLLCASIAMRIRGGELQENKDR